jgi:membrane-associated phospholipid phosphatase
MRRGERNNSGEDGVAVALSAEMGAARNTGQVARFDLGRGGIAAWMGREMDAAWAACGAFEWVALSYLGLSSVLMAMFAENLAHPVKLIGLQALVAVGILVLCWWEARVAGGSGAGFSNCERTAKIGCSTQTILARFPSRNLLEAGRANRSVCATETQKFWHFWRHWYPHLFFLFCFEELGKLVHLVSPRWQDAKLIAADYWLTGVHPSIWLERFATPGRNDFMQFAYLTYFTYLLLVGGILYYRRDWRGYWSVMTYSAVAYGIGYVIAICFPIQSPWFSMAGMWQAKLQGGPFTAAIDFIEHYGRVRGAAFPSEHVAGSFAALWGAWRHRRWLFWVMLPLVLCMCASTIWGRYHYAVDIFGGITTGTLGYAIGEWVMQKRGAISTVEQSA